MRPEPTTPGRYRIKCVAFPWREVELIWYEEYGMLGEQLEGGRLLWVDMEVEDWEGPQA